MNRKQLFILLGVLAGLCLCAAGLGFAGLSYLGTSLRQAVANADDPANVQKIASEIADYTPPEGYQQAAMNILMYKYVMLMPDPKSHTQGPLIILMAFPASSNLSKEQMQTEMQRTFARQMGQGAAMKEVETKTVSIRGKDETVTVLEGTLKNGSLLRQWIAIFDGKNGPILLMIQDNPDRWKDQLVNDFVASIK
jgi:hypothetical protein